MKKFDRVVMAEIDKMSNMDDWSDVDWRRLEKKLFNIKDTPGKYKGTLIDGPASWLRFVQRYSMNKVNIDPKWLEAKKFETRTYYPMKPISKEHFTMDDVLRDALKEIGVDENVAGSSKIS